MEKEKNELGEELECRIVFRGKKFKVRLNFEEYGQEIEEDFNFNKSPENRLTPEKTYSVKEVLPDGNVVLSEIGLVSFAQKFLIVLCKNEGCSGEIFCTDGLCRRCFLKEVAIAGCGELV